MSDERDWYAMNNIQCTDTYAGWRCVLAQGHSGRHSANAAKPESDAIAILQDLINDIVGKDGEGHEITEGGNDECLVCKAVDRAERRLREIQNE